MQPDCLLIADDLTGACDAAVQFALRGLCASVLVNLDVALRQADVLAVSTDGCDPGMGSFGETLSRLRQTDVLAVSTESRDAPMGSFGETLSRLRAIHPRLVFKKIDSTLRGNAAAEVATTLTTFGFDFAIVTPAFPAMGRLVEGGFLRVAGEIGFVPRELAACFRGECFRLRDATCDADLDAIVAEGLASTGRPLWAGSAGLAAALARAIGTGSPGQVGFSPAPAIFCLGSDHAVTLEQQRRLVEGRAAVLLFEESATPESIAAAWSTGPVVLRIRRGQTAASRIGQLLAALRAPLVLCGGDTASLICRALDVHAIELRQEIAPGIPCGVIRGGPFEGLPVVTKSGGFGCPDALMQVADFFTCSQPSH